MAHDIPHISPVRIAWWGDGASRVVVLVLPTVLRFISCLHDHVSRLHGGLHRVVSTIQARPSRLVRYRSTHIMIM
ncbi:hypothetical protein HD806DRAFT_475668 [Xylariaceae sp. AK1471]|nr:hypothetical protein HD806DRAFT_475668 [Xylariaceae sp. AK1471]